jgi:hypothetical protein
VGATVVIREHGCAYNKDDADIRAVLSDRAGHHPFTT